MAQPLPETMKAVELRAYGDAFADNLAIVDRKVPRPGKGEVLVRIAASPINPSDLSFLRGLYVRKAVPVIPGFEASGVVAAVGPGITARAALGRRVACSAPPDGDGAWAQYMRTKAGLCFPLLPRVDLESGAMLIVNPLTVVGLLDVAKREGARAIVHTAAASALGRMLLRAAARRRLPVIHVVRRKSQVDLLRGMGAAHVLDSNDAEFDDRLRELCRSLRATVAFDAVSGAMTGRLLAAMPSGSRVVIYGGLASEAVAAHPSEFIVGDKHIDGFWLTSHVRRLGLSTMLRSGLEIQRRIATDFHTEVRGRRPLSEVLRALTEYAASMTEGKVLLVPNES